MERKYVRAIETMTDDNLAVQPPARALRYLEENLEGIRQNIRELEAKPVRNRPKRR